MQQRGNYITFSSSIAESQEDLKQKATLKHPNSININ